MGAHGSGRGLSPTGVRTRVQSRVQSRVPTPAGDASVALTPPVGPPRALLVLGHGAGGGIDAADLVAARDHAAAGGLAVALVEQPYRVAGRRAPAPARQLDAAFVGVVATLRANPAYGAVPLITGGRSSGARVACRTAATTGAVAVVALAFPLHPPGHPERSRLAELTAVRVPVLVVQGERDPFGRPAEFPPGTRLHVVAGADHALRSGTDELAAVVAAWARASKSP